MYQYPPNYNNNNNRLPLTPNSISPTREAKDIMMEGSTSSSESLNDYPQEITWLFFRDNQWVPFQSNNHYKIEQAFTLGVLVEIGIYVDIKGIHITLTLEIKS
ncbi:hypothetical protein RMCBS344292_15637 [Rhizopus microsporus]|nr:hypothetical protein RMCBS344292_15637 [Rhizopus microsporus]